MKTPVIPPHDERFKTAVYGTVFGQRMNVVHRLRAGDRLILVPDPPGTDSPFVWVHASGGDVIGHLPESISCWMQPWMLDGGCAGASVEKIKGADVASWRRLIIEVHCYPDGLTATD
ncbi:MAG: hypothetical protein WKG32_23975 [Gemmatimonadaceae bacterium]